MTPATVTPAARSLPAWVATRASFDPLVERALLTRLSLTEEALLRDSHWHLGQDARLREDLRFRPTPWGQWIVSTSFLANDALFQQLHQDPRHPPDLEEALRELEARIHRHCVFCTADPRFVLDGGKLRLAARELSTTPLIEDQVGDLEKYQTHLPVYSLRAAAASLPAGDWGRAAQEEVIAPLGWLAVSTGHKLNPRQFVARIEGHSMDDGRSGLVDGGYAIFEWWPAGTRQNLNVLVRGAFTDPETGHYAVKKYRADQRDAEGRHQRISLVSLNPDKARYPDIALEVAEEAQITVVAKVVDALRLEDFARRPRPARRPGRRDLSSPEALAEINQSLADHLARFFAPVPVGDLDDEADAAAAAAARAEWRAELVCLPAEAGGLHLEVGPLLGLWRFVKQLRLKGTDLDQVLLAANLRMRPVRVPVLPASAPWTWTAAGFEDDPDVDVSALDTPALPSTRVTVFRVDAEGIGRQVSSQTLSPGQGYRLLLAEELLTTLAQRPAVSPLGPGWWLWELEVRTTLPAEITTLLRDLELEVGETQAALDWVLVPPVAWRFNPKGLVYPCFLADQAPVVRVEGPDIEAPGTATLFVHGPSGHQVLPLPLGSRHLVRLDSLSLGPHAVQILHDRTRIAPERLVCEVIAAPPAPPPAQWRLKLADQVITPGAEGLAMVPPQDLAAWDEAEAPTAPLPLEIEAPPGWPVRVLWRELAEDLLGDLHADQAGRVDAAAVLAMSRERRRRHTMGDLVLDLGELGAATLQHERRATPTAIQAELQTLVNQRGEMVQRLAGAYLQLRPLWFERICTALGYELEPTPVGDASTAPAHVVAYPLQHTERLGTSIHRQPVRLLLLVEDLSQPLTEPLLGWLDDICAAAGLRDVLVSDGLRWAAHRRNSRLALQVWDLGEVVREHQVLLDFLHVAAEGV